MGKMDVHFSSASNEWATPQEFFNRLNQEFNFNLDPCATPESAKCPMFFTQEQNGLNRPWGGVQSVYESPIWTRNRPVDRKGVYRSAGGGASCVLDPCPDGYNILASILHEGAGNTIRQGAA